MQMLLYITNHENTVNPILAKMMEAKIQGATVFDCEGMLSALNQDSVDAPPMFGSLRKFINQDRQQNKMILVVLRDEEIHTAVEIIHSVTGDLHLPNTGIVFTLPVTRWEGVVNE